MHIAEVSLLAVGQHEPCEIYHKNQLSSKKMYII